MNNLDERALKVVDSINESAAAAASAARDRTEKAAQAAGAAAQAATAAVKDTTQKAVKLAQSQGAASVKQVGGMISKSPWTAVAVAATVGFLLARPWRRPDGSEKVTRAR